MSSDESENESGSATEESDEELPQEESQKVREKLSTLSFEDLISMKEKLGSKVYNQAVLGVTKPKKENMDFKRANKNRPREISSKIRPKRNITLAVPVVKKVIARDPRFDPLCGTFDDKSFKADYKFVNEIRQNEKKQLEKEYNECTDPDRKKKIKYLIQRIDNQLREKRKVENEKLKKDMEKKEVREKLQRGEKPVFKKKSVKRLETLIEKYEELKKTNKLQKHIEKRSKKLTHKDRKKSKGLLG